MHASVPSWGVIVLIDFLVCHWLVQKKGEPKVKDCNKEDNWTCITFKVRALARGVRECVRFITYVCIHTCLREHLSEIRFVSA